MAVAIRTANEKSALLEAAYDEYCRQQESSQGLDVEQFLSRYSTIRSSLRRQIEVHDFLADRSQLVDLCHDAPWPEIGSEVFDFTILEELGRGAFARVYLCRQSGVGNRQVVVKFAAEGAYEADTLGRLSHSNIMPVHSVQFDEATGHSAICMPFRGRSTLCDLVDRTFSGAALPSRAEAILSVARQDIGPDDQLDNCGPPDPYLMRASYVDGVAHLGIQLAEAIAHAHQRGIRHNDLKPSNVLLTAAGRPLLLDFNLANNDARGPQTPGGTMPYMSPEQLAEFRYAEGVELQAIDERSDVFSLGVILFELLAGRLPFGEIRARPAHERAKNLAAAQAKGPASLRKLNPQVDRSLAKLIEQCLSVERSERPVSAAALAEELRRYLSLAQRGRRWAGRNRVALTSMVAALFVLASVATGLYSLRDSYPVRQYKLALAEFRGGRLDATVDTLNPLIATSPQDADALYLRGLAHMRAKRYQSAIADLEAARRIRPDSRIQAAQAYCLCRLQYFREARFLYTKAMEAGYEYNDAKNNLAYCYLLQKKLAEAMTLLKRIDKDKQDVFQVRFIRSSIRLQSDAPIDEEDQAAVLDDCRRMLELSPPNAHLEFFIAKIHALVGRNNPRYHETSLDHLVAACHYGLPFSKEMILQVPDFDKLQRSPRFLNAVELLPGDGRDPLPDPLIEPDSVVLLAAD